MRPADLAVLYGFILFLVYILMPAIPAIIIYWIFPDDKIKAEGFLGKLKINATGAFAGYLIILIVSHFLVPQIQDLISNSAENNSWIVKSKVVFVDSNDKIDDSINSDSVRLKLQTTTNPNYFKKDLNAVLFSAFYEKGGVSSVTYAYPGYKNAEFNLSELSFSSFDEYHHIINIGTVKMIEEKQNYNNKGTHPTEQPASIPFEGPPLLHN